MTETQTRTRNEPAERLRRWDTVLPGGPAARSGFHRDLDAALREQTRITVKPYRDLIEAARIILTNEVPSGEAWRTFETAYDTALAALPHDSTPTISSVVGRVDGTMDVTFEDGSERRMTEQEYLDYPHHGFDPHDSTPGEEQ